MDQKLSEKFYPDEQLREKVTIRVLPQKMQVYPRFKELVTERLGSDVCFVTTSLWEAFLNAMENNPPTSNQQIEMQFMRQNVQINIGCQILYQPKKARRTPTSKAWTEQDRSFPFYINRDDNPLLPEFLDQWQHLSDQAKNFWRKKLIEKGIFPLEFLNTKPEPPPISTPAHDKPLKKIYKTLKNSMTNVCGWLKKRFWCD